MLTVCNSVVQTIMTMQIHIDWFHCELLLQ